MISVCFICHKEYPEGTRGFRDGRCVNRKLCYRRALPGRMPRFVTLGYVPRTPWGYRNKQHLMDLQADEYHRVMAAQREARRPDLAVV